MNKKPILTLIILCILISGCIETNEKKPQSEEKKPQSETFEFEITMEKQEYYLDGMVNVTYKYINNGDLNISVKPNLPWADIIVDQNSNRVKNTDFVNCIDYNTNFSFILTPGENMEFYRILNTYFQIDNTGTYQITSFCYYSYFNETSKEKMSNTLTFKII